MNLLNLSQNLRLVKTLTGPPMVAGIEDVFRTLIKKKYGSDDNFDVICK